MNALLLYLFYSLCSPLCLWAQIVSLLTVCTLLFSCAVNSRVNGRNIVECYMLCPFAHPVACCCVLLRVVAQSFKPVKRLARCKREQQLPTLLGVVASVCT